MARKISEIKRDLRAATAAAVKAGKALDRAYALQQRFQKELDAQAPKQPAYRGGASMCGTLRVNMRGRRSSESW